jgi:hypothetical protein
MVWVGGRAGKKRADKMRERIGVQDVQWVVRQNSTQGSKMVLKVCWAPTGTVWFYQAIAERGRRRVDRESEKRNARETAVIVWTAVPPDGCRDGGNTLVKKKREMCATSSNGDLRGAGDGGM